jgi:uncharacterized LabA/DUF88 family protein
MWPDNPYVLFERGIHEHRAGSCERADDYYARFIKTKEGVDHPVAHAYATHRGDKKQLQFQNILRAIGFTVELKAVLKRRDGTTKADWDVGIALDVFEAAPKCDTIVLASGDGDFGILLDRIRERFKTKSEVYGVRALTSNQLIGPAGRFVPIDEKLLLPPGR